MTKREVVKAALDHKKVPYTPWQFGFTLEARQKLARHYGSEDLDKILGNHCLGLGDDIGFFKDMGNGRVRDAFGAVWDRSVDKDIGVVETPALAGPTLEGYHFPDPTDKRFFVNIPEKLRQYPDCFRMFQVGFSLYERAWTLRGMENLLMDFVENPVFVHELLDAICEYNLAHVEKALTYDIDAVEFGDDWGQQSGLIMGPKIWYEFIEPRLKRMYAMVRQAGKYQVIHSCGDVDELFDHLISIGLNCFNPFQPEVMDTRALMKAFRGRLSFFGGLSTQKTLPYGSVADVRAESRRLLEAGRAGDYIFAPAHAVEGDVPLENMLAFIEEAQGQKGYRKNGVME